MKISSFWPRSMAVFGRMHCYIAVELDATPVGPRVAFRDPWPVAAKILPQWQRRASINQAVYEFSGVRPPLFREACLVEFLADDVLPNLWTNNWTLENGQWSLHAHVEYDWQSWTWFSEVVRGRLYMDKQLYGRILPLMFNAGCDRPAYSA